MSLLTLKCASIVIYRITFHPLARYPGPLLAKVTDAYAAYHGFCGDIHVDIWKCHAKYGTSYVISLTYSSLISRSIGTFVRYGPNRVVMNTQESLHGSQQLPVWTVSSSELMTNRLRYLWVRKECEKVQSISHNGTR